MAIPRNQWFTRPDGSSIRDLVHGAVERDWRDIITPELRERYREDGVVHVPGLLHPEWLALVEQGMKRNADNPGYNCVHFYEGQPDEYIMDHDNYAAIPEYQYLLRHSPIGDIMQFLLATDELYLFHDQIFIKRGGNNAITHWHQDLPYWIIDGTQLGSMWITLDPQPKEQCLEFIPGSHKGPQYGGSTFKHEDPTDPTYPSLPRIPHIEAERDKWNIVSWDVQPGDVILLHPNVLHGGGGTGPGQQRRTITLRFFGDDAVIDGRFEQSGELCSPFYPGLTRRLRPGDKVRDDRFPLIRPIPRS